MLAAPGAVAYPRPQRLPARQPLGVVSGGAALAKGVAGVALDVSSSRLMDRLVRSRGWIVIVAFGLIGIVAMQVSMLKLNAGIGRAVETVSTLERSNATMRGEVSRLSSGDRIQSLASARGFVMPAPADVTYLRSHNLRADGVVAARRMQAPDRSIAGPAGSSLAVAPPPAPVAGTAAPAAGQAAPAATAAPAASAAPAVQPVAPASPATAAPSTATSPASAPTAAPAATAPAQQTTATSAGGVAPPPAATGVGGP